MTPLIRYSLFYLWMLFTSSSLADSIDRICEGKFLRPTADGYNTTSKVVNDKLNVHLIPHTHDDAGWVMTYERYYITKVNSIISNVITQLNADPNRRFMYVEQAFFQMWWKEQTEDMKDLVRQLVKEGRLDLGVSGAWVMHDEAATHYSVTIDMTALGHEYLWNEFQVIPSIGWQIDPFGQSATQGSILSSGFDYDAMYATRIDHQEYDIRKKNKNLELMWRPSPSRGKYAQIFTGIIQDTYLAPKPINFGKSSTMIVDDPELDAFNLCDDLNTFLEIARNRSTWTQGNHIFIPMGDDFAYENALPWFQNMDKLIHYANQEGSVNVLYSTVSLYTKVKSEEAAELATYEVKTDDFMPYAHATHNYWSGYFTSRPNVKKFSRVANALMQQVRTLEVQYLEEKSNIDKLRREVSLVQHHDGISGTEKQFVADDYMMRIYQGVVAAEKHMNLIFSKIEYLNADVEPFQLCLLTNVSVCNVTTANSKPFEVLVYNPLGHRQTATVKLPIQTDGVIVSQVKNNLLPTPVKAYVYPITPAYSKSLPGEGKNELVFPADLAPWELQHYLVIPTGTSLLTATALILSPDEGGDEIIVMENEFLRVEFSRSGGSTKFITNKKKKLKIPMSTELYYYRGVGGAYIFAPRDDNKRTIEVTEIKVHKSAHGSVCRITTTFADWGTIEYELNEWDTMLGVHWTIGPIPIDDHQGKNVIIAFNTNGAIKSNDEYYIDSNGLEYIRRMRNKRDTWDIHIDNYNERIASNFYPMTTGMFIRDNTYQLGVLTDRAQAASSLENGQLDIMIHRRLLKDDRKGVHEALNETETITFTKGEQVTQGLTARGMLQISLESSEDGLEQIREVGEKSYITPMIAVRPATATAGEKKSVKFPRTVLLKELPENLGLTTAVSLDSSCYLLRFTHLYGKDEHSKFSQPVELDFSTFISKDKNLKMVVDEMTLDGIHTLQEKRERSPERLNFHTVENARNAYADQEGCGPSNPLIGTNVTLKALEVRAFRVCFTNLSEAELVLSDIVDSKFLKSYALPATLTALLVFITVFIALVFSKRRRATHKLVRNDDNNEDEDEDEDEGDNDGDKSQVDAV